MNTFTTITDTIGREIINAAKQVNLPANTTVFYQGAACENFLLVTEGVVKVFTRAENGREIVLYRVRKGQSCTLTMTCLLSKDHYPAEGITEQATSALTIPLSDFNRGLALSKNFREYVFNGYSKHLSDVITLVGEVSFNRIDIRLAKKLICLIHNDNTLTITHQALAIELGTAREVISRQLKVFEENNWLSLSRGNIKVNNISALKALADTPLI